MSIGERLDIQPAYFALARSLASLLMGQYRLREIERPVIAIAGESGSGKSVTATCLARELEAAKLPAALLHQDDYFLRPPKENHAHRVRDPQSVGPQEVDLDLLTRKIAAFRAGDRSAALQRVDYAADRFVSEHVDFSAAKVLIVEGTYVLRVDTADIRIFLEATHDETLERRRARQRDAEDPAIERFLEIEHRIISAQAPLAQITVGPDFRVRR